MKNSRRIRIAVILLNYKTADSVISQVMRIRHLPTNADLKYIVIDNNSCDGSFSKFEKTFWDDDVILFKSGENGGYAKGNNIGLRYAVKEGFDYSWVINSDIEFNDIDVLNKLARILQSNKRLGVVSPYIVSEDGYKYNPEIPKPTFMDLTFGMLAYRKKGRHIPASKNVSAEYCKCYRPQGCCMLINNKMIKQTGFLDEHTFLYYEEYILAERMKKCGYNCALAINTYVVHMHDGKSTVEKAVMAKSLMATLRSKISYQKIYGRSYLYYLKKYRKFGSISRMICWCFLQLKLMVLKR